MKYITPELLQNQNNADLKIANKADVAIQKKHFEYERYYDSIKHIFPKYFLKIYESNSRFHDWNIEAVSYFPSENQKNDVVELKISHIDVTYIIKFRYVTKFFIDMDFSQTSPLNMPEKDIYYLDEWELLDNDKISYEMLSLSWTSIKIVCKKVSIIRYTR